MRCLRYSFFPLFLVFAATAAHPYPDSTADEKAGAGLYRDKGCAQCHGADLAGNKRGPGLADIRNDPAWPAEKITKQIRDGGQKMPPFGESLTDQEIAQLVAFLRAEHRPEPPPPTNPPSN
jgi:mono/diheme cytochrome c family protein